ncbi:MAG: hypothetical protein VX223_15900 [Myxococcota bacterium]|nr:hypothetical protein [Myxococcota bacterium]
MRIIRHVSFRSMFQAELSIGVVKYLANLGQRVALIQAERQMSMLDAHLGKAPHTVAIFSAAHDGLQQTDYEAAPTDAETWSQWATSHDIDILWLNTAPGAALSIPDTDVSLALVGPSIQEAETIAECTKRGTDILAIYLPADDIPQTELQHITALLSHPFRTSPKTITVRSKAMPVLTDNLRSNEKTLSIDETSIQKLALSLIDSDTLTESVRPAIKAALAGLLDNPDGTYAKLASLAELYPHPETLLAVMKFYRLQPRIERLPLADAIRYWRMTGDAAHPVLSDILQHALDHAPQSVPTDFAMSVASAQSTLNDTIALTVAKRLNPQNQVEAVAVLELLDPVVLQGRATANDLASYLPSLATVRGAAAAHETAREQASRFRTVPTFHIAWATALLNTADDDILRTMLVDPRYNGGVVTQNAPELAKAIANRLAPADKMKANALVDYEAFLQCIRDGHTSIQSADIVANAVNELHRLKRLDADQQLAFSRALEEASKRWAKRSYMQRLWQKLPIELDPLVPLRLRS